MVRRASEVALDGPRVLLRVQAPGFVCSVSVIAPPEPALWG
ncbi:MAG: hypothetical protein AAF183_02155 [Pseudomonadota bacterium]